MSMLEGEFEPQLYRDEYRERVHAFAVAKAEGRRVRLKEPVLKVTDRVLSDALRASLKQPQKGKVTRHAAKKARAASHSGSNVIDLMEALKKSLGTSPRSTPATRRSQPRARSRDKS